MKWLWLLLFIIVMLPPLVHKDLYLIINDDTAAHLMVFDGIKNGDNVLLYPFLYLGQKIVGYSLVFIEKITKIDIPTLFMWFNYLSLFISGICVGLLVQTISGSKLSGVLSAYMVIFGIPSTLHLFYSGTIFNIIEILILIPIILLVIYKLTQYKNKYLYLLITPILVVAYKFHPSLSYSILGINNALPYENIINPLAVVSELLGGAVIGLLLLSCVIIYKTNQKVDIGTKVILIILTILMATMFTLSYIGITNYSTRLILNGCLMLGIIISIMVGLAINHHKSKLIAGIITAYVVFSITPNLIYWLSFPIIAR